MQEGKRKIPVQYFRNLMAVALADGIILPSEIDFFIAKAIEYGLTQDEVDDIIENANSLEFVPPSSQVDRIDHLIDIVSMSITDGVIHEKEYALCLHITERLGLKKKDLDEAVQMAKMVMNSGMS